MTPELIERLCCKIKDGAPFCLSPSVRLLKSDADINPDLPPRHKNRPLRPASVLVALVPAGDGFNVLLTKRTAHLNSHAGEVSFPGGRQEDGDKDAIATALREAEEEVGIPPQCVKILGTLPPYRTGTGFEVTAVLGLVSGPFELRPDPNEVDEVFHVPLAHVMNKAKRQILTRRFGDHDYAFYAMPYDTYYIWGVTAALFVNVRRAFRHFVLEGDANP